MTKIVETKPYTPKNLPFIFRDTASPDLEYAPDDQAWQKVELEGDIPIWVN